MVLHSYKISIYNNYKNNYKNETYMNMCVIISVRSLHIKLQYHTKNIY